MRHGKGTPTPRRGFLVEQVRQHDIRTSAQCKYYNPDAKICSIHNSENRLCSYPEICVDFRKGKRPAHVLDDGIPYTMPRQVPKPSYLFVQYDLVEMDDKVFITFLDTGEIVQYVIMKNKNTLQPTAVTKKCLYLHKGDHLEIDNRACKISAIQKHVIPK